ncbi:MAG: D-aminoacyl-tRNA deacylase, partial [Candidatus Bathyarchaeota archaeon]
MPVVICSEQCTASQNIKYSLINRHGFSPAEHEKFEAWSSGEVLLVEVPDKLVEVEYLDKYLDTDYYIFASKHKSESGKPCLTVHCCGNWGQEAKVGGKPRKLAYSAPIPKKIAFEHLVLEEQDDFDVTMECTHHGPTEMETPLMFIEIGSTEKEWDDRKAGNIISDAIMKAADAGLKRNFKIAIGAGGTHYCPSFSSLETGGNIAFAHIIPNYAVDKLEEETFLHAIEKSNPEFIVIDWKGLKG